MTDPQAAHPQDELDELLYRVWCQALDARAMSEEEMSDATAEEAETAYLVYQKRALAAAKATLLAYVNRQRADELKRLQFTIDNTRASMEQPEDLTSHMAIRVRLLELGADSQEGRQRS